MDFGGNSTFKTKKPAAVPDDTTAGLKSCEAERFADRLV